MKTEFPSRCRIKGLVLAGAAALMLGTGGATAQIPPAGPPPDGGIPPGPPRGQPPTAAQQLVAELPQPAPGGGVPLPPLEADAPMPAADPRDLQGTWIHNQGLEFRITRDMYGAPLPYTMDGAKVLARRVNAMASGKPYINASALCRPPGPQWQFDLNFAWQVFQSKDWIEFVFEEYHGRWHVILDPAKALRPAEQTYQGYSVGKWNGDTLVVETSDFKQGPWLDVDGTPLSSRGKISQRIRKVNAGERDWFLEIVTTVDDPAYYTRPWSFVRTYGWQPDLTLYNEYNCEEQIGDPNVRADAGLVPEPQE